MSDEQIREKLKTLRKKFEYTQDEMGRMLKMHRTTYTKLENGPTRLSLDLAVKLSQIFHVPVTEFLPSEKPSPTPGTHDVLPKRKTGSRKKAVSVTDNTSFIYNLEREERVLVGIFRQMSPSEKEALFRYLEQNQKDR